MRRTRRQTLNRTFEIVGASLVLLDVLLYIGIYRPVQAMVASEQQKFVSTREHILDEKDRIERLQNFLGSMPQGGDSLASFKKDHTPPRHQGFSQAAKLVRSASDAAGTQLVSRAYKLDTKPSGPVQRLALVITITGPFPALVKFAHALETASEFVVIQSFTIAPGDNNDLQLRLSADLYLTP